MKINILRTLAVCAFLLALSFAANAQSVNVRTKKESSNSGVAVMKGTGKAAVIVVGSAAKVAWEVTKVSAKYVVKPLALTVAPAVAKFALKNSVKYALPLIVRLSLL